MWNRVFARDVPQDLSTANELLVLFLMCKEVEAAGIHNWFEVFVCRDEPLEHGFDMNSLASSIRRRLAVLNNTDAPSYIRNGSLDNYLRGGEVSTVIPTERDVILDEVDNHLFNMIPSFEDQEMVSEESDVGMTDSPAENEEMGPTSPIGDSRAGPGTQGTRDQQGTLDSFLLRSSASSGDTASQNRPTVSIVVGRHGLRWARVEIPQEILEQLAEARNEVRNARRCDWSDVALLAMKEFVFQTEYWRPTPGSPNTRAFWEILLDHGVLSGRTADNLRTKWKRYISQGFQEYRSMRLRQLGA
jgi:hypothetical protein